MTDAVQNHLKTLVEGNAVVLFMKGTAEAPMCGFSARAAGILRHMGVDFVDVNVLENQDIREGVKTLSQWPTIPQLYVNGTFVGGSDIMTEMYQAGELHELLGVELPSVETE